MRTELARPMAFPEPYPSSVEVRETHISCVFLGDRDVFKVKKPVDFGFLDFRTIDARKRACEAEVQLNRRLGPDVYVGVVPVVRKADGGWAFGGEGSLVDWAVHMRRMPDDARADILLERGMLSAGLLDAVAERLAAFHATCRCDAQTAEWGSPAAILTNVTENFAQTRGHTSGLLTSSEAGEIEQWQLSFVRRHEPIFAARVASCRIRDGHGDLRLEHVYFGRENAITILDCIEFNDRFRFADVCADVAFLAMDLAWHGRVDLAERFLARYARASGDFDLYSLLDFYESYRAYVRGKLAALMVDSPAADESSRMASARDARRYFLLALAARRSAVLAPILVCVGGIIASGKTTIAQAIADDLAAPVVEADLTRKQMLGIDPCVHLNDPSWSGAYDPAFTDRVYAEVLRRAQVVLASGRPVVIDASFRSAKQRALAHDLARSAGVPIRYVECHVDPQVARARLVRRESEAAISDGRLAIFDDFCKQFEAMSELAPTEHVAVDSSGETRHALEAVRARVATWPRGLLV